MVPLASMLTKRPGWRQRLSQRRGGTGRAPRQRDTMGLLPCAHLVRGERRVGIDGRARAPMLITAAGTITPQRQPIDGPTTLDEVARGVEAGAHVLGQLPAIGVDAVARHRRDGCRPERERLALDGYERSVGRQRVAEVEHVTPRSAQRARQLDPPRRRPRWRERAPLPPRDSRRPQRQPRRRRARAAPRGGSRSTSRPAGRGRPPRPSPSVASRPSRPP